MNKYYVNFHSIITTPSILENSSIASISTVPSYSGAFSQNENEPYNILGSLFDYALGSGYEYSFKVFIEEGVLCATYKAD